MKIGIGGSLGPFRAGISTRGLGIGVGPLHASTGYRRRRRRSSRSSASGCGTLLLISLAIAVVYYAVAWPYLLGTSLAVRLGAGPHSTGRVVCGWAVEIIVVLAVCAFLLARYRGNQLRRAEQERQTRRQELADTCDLLENQLGRLDTTMDLLTANPDGLADPRIKPKERLLAAFDDVRLLEPRSAHRGGQKIPTPVDTGIAYVTDQSIRFHGNTKNVEWRFDKLHAVGTEHDAYQFSVSNRQLVSGIGTSDTTRPALDVALRWALALAAGAGVPTRQTEARAARDGLVQALKSGKSELSTHELAPVAARGCQSG